MFILFRPIKGGVLSLLRRPQGWSKGVEDVTRHLLVALTGAIIITIVILAAAMTGAAFLKARNEAARQQKQIQTQALRENNAPMGIYERVPGGWKNVESGEVYQTAPQTTIIIEEAHSSDCSELSCAGEL